MTLDADGRRESMQEFIDKAGFVRLADLSEQFGVSPITVHRDLDYLASLGAIERVRGGARSAGGPRHEIRTDFNLRRVQMAEAKVVIARRALQEIPDRATVFLDSSTTVLALATALAGTRGKGLTLVTNSPAIAYQLQEPSTHILVIPGDVNQSLRAITGEWATEFLRGLTIDVAFVSAAGIEAGEGIMTTQRSLAELTKTAFERSARHVALIDSSKFDTPALITMASFDQVDLIITDDGITDDTVDRYGAAGARIAIGYGDDRTEGAQESS